jgi:hypothetical protein
MTRVRSQNCVRLQDEYDCIAIISNMAREGVRCVNAVRTESAFCSRVDEPPMNNR